MLVKARQLTRGLSNRFQDWILNIDTGGIIPADRPGAVHYATIAYAEIKDTFRRLDLRASDIFVDVGVGKGRVLCLAARWRMQRAIGVECSPELAKQAKLNVCRMRGKRTEADVYEQAAEEFDYSGATALYFFNPFEADILDIVLHKIKKDRNGKAIRLVFIMESPQQRGVFKTHGWLECCDRWIDRSGHPNALYRSVCR